MIPCVRHCTGPGVWSNENVAMLGHKEPFIGVKEVLARFYDVYKNVPEDQLD